MKLRRCPDYSELPSPRNPCSVSNAMLILLLPNSCRLPNTWHSWQKILSCTKMVAEINQVVLKFRSAAVEFYKRRGFSFGAMSDCWRLAKHSSQRTRGSSSKTINENCNQSPRTSHSHAFSITRTFRVPVLKSESKNSKRKMANANACETSTENYPFKWPIKYPKSCW